MAQTYTSTFSTHLQTCSLHNSEKKPFCSGTWKRKGGKCSNYATGPPEPGMMPLCRTHKDQLQQSASCRALLTCGSECGRICVWRPHEFQLCSEHSDYPRSCYFLKIPIEIRLRIYGFLLPDQPIPARFTNLTCLTSDGVRVHTAFLRTNRQIHDEAVHLLYGAQVFTIELSVDHLVMCNSSNKSSKTSTCGYYNPQYYRPPFGNLPFGNPPMLQDYQMQLMLLEQQNKQRLILARQEHGSSSSVNHKNPISDPPIIPFTYGPDEPAWNPPLYLNYFNKVQSFLVEIVFPPKVYQCVMSRQTPEEETQALESKLYDYCDNIHKLIGRFRLMPQPLRRLTVVLKFNPDNYDLEREQIISMAQVLLRPFQRLHNIGHPVVAVSLIRRDQPDFEIDILNCPESTLSTSHQTFYDYLTHWTSDLSGSEPALSSPLFKAYWQLERLLFSMKNHETASKFFRFEELRHTARMAREAGDIQSFRAVGDRVREVWKEYVDAQRRFQENVEVSMEAIDFTVDGDLGLED